MYARYIIHRIYDEFGDFRYFEFITLLTRVIVVVHCLQYECERSLKKEKKIKTCFRKIV